MFFVWEAGLLETIKNNAGEIVKESFFDKVWKRVLKIALRKFGQSDGDRAADALPAVDTTALEAEIDRAVRDEDVASLLAGEPAIPGELSELSESEQRQLEAELLADPQLAVEIQAISNGLRTPEEVEIDRANRAPLIQGSTVTLMDPEAVDQLVDRPTPGERGLLSAAKVVKAVVQIAARTIWRFVRKRHHGVHATVVEEILRAFYVANVGGRIWTTMKGDTADAFKDDATVYGGTAFLTALRDRLDPAAPPRVTLVGHSTGAVYISEFLVKADEILPGGMQFDVIFLAPASTFEKTAATLNDYAHRIAHFRSFAMKDEVEKADRLVPVLYLRTAE